MTSDKQKQPLVSVIIPVYNRLNCLKRSINSVLAQEYDNYELIVVDDGSKEDVESFIETIKNRSKRPVIFIRQENQGPGIARRTGLTAANGKYIQYLDSDDEILPEKLSKQVNILERKPDAVMCYTPTIQVATDGSRGLRKFSNQEETDLLRGSLQWRRWHTSSCLWHYYDKGRASTYWIGLYNGEDVVHDVSAGIYENKVVFLNEPLTISHTGVENISRKPTESVRQERYNRDTLNCPVLCYERLVAAGLNSNPLYAEPLAERFFYNSLKLAKFQEVKKAVNGIGYSLKLTKDKKRTIELKLFLYVIKLTRGKFPNLLSALFIFHRFAFPASVHFNRRI